ncbi:MAG: hypothetical protein WCX64_04020 [Candidatus Micrarchaeia archaeon]
MKKILETHGFHVVNVNSIKGNYQLYDLIALRESSLLKPVFIQVKNCSAKGQKYWNISSTKNGFTAVKKNVARNFFYVFVDSRPGSDRKGKCAIVSSKIVSKYITHPTKTDLNVAFAEISLLSSDWENWNRIKF